MTAKKKKERNVLSCLGCDLKVPLFQFFDNRFRLFKKKAWASLMYTKGKQLFSRFQSK